MLPLPRRLNRIPLPRRLNRIPLAGTARVMALGVSSRKSFEAITTQSIGGVRQ